MICMIETVRRLLVACVAVTLLGWMVASAQDAAETSTIVAEELLVEELLGGAPAGTNE